MAGSQSSDHLCGPSLDLLQPIPTFLHSGDQNWTQHSKCGWESTEQSRMMTSNLLFMMQPSIPLAFLATAAHCSLIRNLLSTRTPTSLSMELLPRWADPSLCCTPGSWTDPSYATTVRLLLWPFDESTLYLMSTDDWFSARSFLPKKNFFYVLILPVLYLKGKNNSLIQLKKSSIIVTFFYLNSKLSKMFRYTMATQPFNNLFVCPTYKN